MKILLTILFLLPLGLFAQTSFTLTSKEYYDEVEYKKGPEVTAETLITLTPSKVIIETKGKPKQEFIVKKVHQTELYPEITFEISPLRAVSYNTEEKKVYLSKPNGMGSTYLNCKPVK